MILIIILPIVLLIIIYTPVNSTYSVTATTERIEFKTLDDNNSKLVLYNAKVYNDNYERIDTLTPLSTSRLDDVSGFDGSFKIAIGSITTIERIANGNLSVQIVGENNKSAGTFYSHQEDEVLDVSGNVVEFYIDDIDQRTKNGETIIIPITGIVNMGRSVNYDSYGSTTAIVRSGQVTVISTDLLKKHMFESNTFDLNIGDQFDIEKPSSKAYGFAVINENSAMSLSYKISGLKGIITTPGPIDSNKGYVIKPNLLIRFANDGIIKSISLSFTILLSIAGLLPLFQRLLMSETSSKKSSKKKT